MLRSEHYSQLFHSANAAAAAAHNDDRSQAPIFSLTDEPFNRVISFLELRSLGRAALVSQRFSSASAQTLQRWAFVASPSVQRSIASHVITPVTKFGGFAVEQITGKRLSHLSCV